MVRVTLPQALTARVDCERVLARTDRSTHWNRFASMIGEDCDPADLQSEAIRCCNYAAAYFIRKQMLRFLQKPWLWALGDIYENLMLEQASSIASRRRSDNGGEGCSCLLTRTFVLSN